MTPTTNAHKEEVEFTQPITSTKGKCPTGEDVGHRGMEHSKIPVLSCEGACIRGEIARLAANMIAQEKPYARGCHGELLTVPESAIALWIRSAEKVVLIDGCFLRCHGRMLEHLLGDDQLIQFDALAVHRKYNDLFDVYDVPEADRLATARSVADSILERLISGKESSEENLNQRECCCG